jgi:site-specific DNA recombinase
MTRRRLAAVPDTPRRGLALIRVSKARGREDLVSPELQRTAIGDYAARQGIDVVEWVEALDESASRARSAWWARLEQAVGQVEAGERDVVLVWKFHRAARRRRQWAVALDRIEVAGGTIESATEGIDTTTSAGRFTRGMLAEMAAFEAERIGEQWKEAQARRRRLGLPHTGGPRFGYTYSREHGYQPHPEQAPVLAELYRRYTAGEGFLQLAAWLNAQQVPTMRGGRWAVQTLIRQLDSGFAAGLLYIHRTGELLPGAQPRLITGAEWQQYQAQRARLRKMPARTRRPVYPLSGLVRCGLCRSSMSAYSTPRGVGYMLRCTGWSSARTCTGVWITRAAVERHVRAWVTEQAGDLDVRAATTVARRAAATAAKVDRARLARRVTALDTALTRLTVDRASGLVPELAYRQARDQISSERDDVTALLEQAQEDAVALSGSHTGIVRGLDRDWDTLATTDRRDLLAALLRRVEVRPDEPRVVPHPRWEPDPWAVVPS